MFRKAIAITALAMIIAPAVHAKVGASAQVGTVGVGAEAGIRRGGVGKPPIQSNPSQGYDDPWNPGNLDPNTGYNNQNGGA